MTWWRKGLSLRVGARSSTSAPGEVTCGRCCPDAPLLRLPDDEAIHRYLRTHYLPASVAQQVTAPLTVTKRGCLVIAVKDS